MGLEITHEFLEARHSDASRNTCFEQRLDRGSREAET